MDKRSVEVSSFLEFKEVFLEAIEQIDVDIEEEKIQKFYKFYSSLIETNKVMNLTGIVDLEGVVYKHFIDSLLLIRNIPDLDGEYYKIIDIGTGAGFPGLPLAIAFDNIEIVLMDSLQKRIKFLDTVIRDLGLKNVKAIHSRAEDLAREPLHREKYDIAVSRAVANLGLLSEYSLPFVKEEGFFIPYKSGDIDEEVEEAKEMIAVLGGKVMVLDKFELDYEDNKRSFVVIEKRKKTDKKYPRKAGSVKKEKK